MEMSRLSGRALADVQASRFEIGREVAAATGAAVLLKGVPTVISAPPPGRERLVSGAGTPILATGGSGDVLAGIAATMLAQTGDPVASGAIATWVQGRAAERAGGDAALVRGRTLGDVVAALPAIWGEVADPERPAYPILAELPGVGE
jgi:NAD(P)H-hydrate epimerase